MVVVITVVDEPVPMVYVRVVSDVTADGEPAPGAPDPGAPLPPVVRGIIDALVTVAPELSDAVALAVGTTMDPEPETMAEEMIEELTAEAWATGQTVVVKATISVTTTPAEAWLRAGQLVTVGAQLVMV